MRHLSRKQKNLIRKFVKNKYSDNSQDCGLSPDRPAFFNCNQDMPTDVYWLISRVHEFECFDSHVDRFIDDIRNISDCKIIQKGEYIMSENGYAIMWITIIAVIFFYLFILAH